MQTENLVLRPNCLLTQSPLVFISGPRSLFAPDKIGSGLQEFIAAHGYQITPLWMPFRSLKQRNTALKNWLKVHRAKKFHFIMAYETWLELKDTLNNSKEIISSLSVVSKKETIFIETKDVNFCTFFVTPITAPLSYQLHRLFCFLFSSPSLPYEMTLLSENQIIYDRFLDHCVQLAENEHI